MPIIKILLPVDRSMVGSLICYSSITGVREFGPIPCLGRGQHRAQNLEFGDTPIGRYDVTGVKKPNPDALGLAQYGPNSRIKLKGASSVALTRDTAAGGDAALRIHGGRQSGDRKILVATQGCIRVLDFDMHALLQYLSLNVITYPISLEIGNTDSLDFQDIVVDLTTVDVTKDTP